MFIIKRYGYFFIMFDIVLALNWDTQSQKIPIVKHMHNLKLII